MSKSDIEKLIKKSNSKSSVLKSRNNVLTLDVVKDSVPPKFRNSITPRVIEMLNHLSNDPDEARSIADNIISFSAVLQEGKFTLESYVNAVVYNSHKLMGKTNKESYIATFPERYQSMVDRGKTDKQMSGHIAAYNSNILVNLVAEKAAIPVWLLNQDIYQQAINTQFELMQDITISPKVRSDAANSLLTHLKKPEIKNNSPIINIGINADNGLKQLEDKLTQLASKQLENIKEEKSDITDITEEAIYE